MIAQIPTATNAQLLNFLVGGAGVLGLIYLVLCVWHKGRELLGRSDPMKVESVHPVTLREVQESVDRLENRLGKLESRLELNFSDWHTQRERQLLELHEKIASVNQSVQRILGRLERPRERN
ncbi:MAG TPA: hypothetical protein VMZ27_06635 [Candidatus Saccharimonadales bacterium]|nr:hypothetical protein [Candidatus Saccharimonadales bacterium]